MKNTHIEDLSITPALLEKNGYKNYTHPTHKFGYLYTELSKKVIGLQW